MNRKITSASTIMAAVLSVSACATLDSPYQFETVYPDTPHVYFHKLHAVEENNKLVVSGRLKKRASTAVAPHGHVDIVVYSAEGVLLLETTTSYISSLNLHSIQQKGGNYFSATLNVIPPSGSYIKIAFHPEYFKSNPSPEHEINMAK